MRRFVGGYYWVLLDSGQWVPAIYNSTHWKWLQVSNPAAVRTAGGEWERVSDDFPIRVIPESSIYSIRARRNPNAVVTEDYQLKPIQWREEPIPSVGAGEVRSTGTRSKWWL